MEKLSYKLSEFEGPLDLLLFLLSKNKVNICDISITELLDQYMDHIHSMQEQDMDISSEFLEMASRLVYMKTMFLLPKHEEAEQLRKELEGELMEYQDCKKLAAELENRFTFNAFVRPPEQIEADQNYRRLHDPMELLEAYRAALGKKKRKLPPAPEAFSGIVSHRIVSVASRIVAILRRLRRNQELPYQALFEEKKDKSDLVATFLAILELMKGKRVRVEKSDDGRDVIELTDGGQHRWRSEKSVEP